MTTFRCYIRLSKDELLKTSPENQRRALGLYCTSQNATAPVVFYEDLGESGGDWNRKEFARMEREAVPGDIVVVTSDDRFARDVDFHRTKLREFGEKGVQVRFLNLPLDTTTATGKFASTISAAAAEHYREVISEKTLAAVPTVREKHVRWGRWPDLFEVTIEEGRQTVHPSKRALIILEEATQRGVTKAAHRYGLHPKKIYRLRKTYNEWMKTRPWFTSHRYGERRAEYQALRRLRQGEKETPADGSL